MSNVEKKSIEKSKKILKHLGFQDACDILHMKEEELDKLMALLPTSRNKQKRVMFIDNASKSKEFASFLSSFDKTDGLKLNSNVSNKVLDKISKFVLRKSYGKDKQNDNVFVL